LNLIFETYSSKNFVWGYIYDAEDPSRRFTVELWADGVVVGVDWASRPTLGSARPGLDGYDSGFRIAIPPVARDAGSLEIRLANLEISLGLPLTAPSPPLPIDVRPIVGTVEWQGGLCISGWVWPEVVGVSGVSAHVDGQKVGVAKFSGVAHAAGEQAPAIRFTLYLPELLADGRAHLVDVMDDDGRVLVGSPLGMIAFPDSLRATLREFGAGATDLARAELHDRLFPQSLPFELFQHWLERFPLPPSRPSQRVAILLYGDGDARVTAESLPTKDELEWVAAHLPSVAGGDGFAPEDLLEVLEGEAAGATLVVLAPAGARFFRGGLARLASAGERFLVYGDFVLTRDGDPPLPVALPQFSYERALEQGYFALLFAASRLVMVAAARKGASDPFSLGFEILGQATQVRHVPGFIAELPALAPAEASLRLGEAVKRHLETKGIGARIEVRGAGRLFPSLRVRRATPDLSVSVVIPTRDRLDLLQRCIETIEPALQRARAQLFIVDNETRDVAALHYLDRLARLGATILRVAGPFNYSRLNNVAVEAASGEALVLLNNDIEAIDDGWLEEMLGRLSAEDVGAVGAKLLWPSGVVQHGGVTLGVSGVADHALVDCLGDAPGYADLGCVAREVSAVTGACLVTRRQDYLAVGGLDEVAFPVAFNDVDYCLKQIARGKRVIFTPHATLVHRASSSRGADRAPDKAARLGGEVRALRARWFEPLANDPFYSPLLALDGPPYSALAWPPRM